MGLVNDLLLSIHPGHFKILKNSDSSDVYVIVRLTKEEKLSRLFVSKTAVEVVLSSSTMKVELLNIVHNPQSSRASIWEDVITVKLLRD